MLTNAIINDNINRMIEMSMSIKVKTIENTNDTATIVLRTRSLIFFLSFIVVFN